MGGGAYDPAAAAAAARRQAEEFLAAVAARLRAYAERHGRPGLLVFAIDTELLGHWLSEGPLWLRAVLEGAEQAGVGLTTVPRALADHDLENLPLAVGVEEVGRRFHAAEDVDAGGECVSPPVADAGDDEEVGRNAAVDEITVGDVLDDGLVGDLAHADLVAAVADADGDDALVRRK